MSSEIAKALRFQMPCDKEFKVTAVRVTDTPTQFTPQLTVTRKRMWAYNLTHSNSGEVYYGPDDTLTPGTGFPIPKGVENVAIPLQSGEATSVYFVAESGQLGDLRVFECG